MDSLFSQLAAGVEAFIVSTGYLGIIILIAVESVFAPIPSEVILPLTGFLVNKGQLWFPGTLLAATLGSVLGALFLYYLSNKLGEKRVLSIAAKYGKWLGLGKDDVLKGMDWFDKHGAKLVLFGRVIPTIRSVVSIPAGITNMPLKKFVLYTSIGSAFWNGLLIGVGWGLGEKWQQVQQYTKYLEYVVLFFIVVFVIWFFWNKHKKKK